MEPGHGGASGDGPTAARGGPPSRRLLVVTPFAETDWRWFGEDFGGPAIRWEFRNLALFGSGPLTWAWRALRAAWKARGCDTVISHQVHMTLYLAAAMKLLRIRRPHFAFTFNHGDGRFLRGPVRFLASHLFRELDGLVVLSQHEKAIYGDYYRVAQERFSFVHWAVRPPEGATPDLPHPAGGAPYVACIGRNNRDFDLFLAAIDGLGIPAVVVCGAGQVRPEQLPPRVTMRCDIPEREAMHILAKATVSVVPLKDASRGAGHVTLVSAMQLGVPQVVTRVATVADYFAEGVHGLFAEPASRESLRDAMLRLWADPALRQQMSRDAKEFAERWFSEAAARRYLEAYLRAMGREGELPVCPPGWREGEGAAQVERERLDLQVRQSTTRNHGSSTR